MTLEEASHLDAAVSLSGPNLSPAMLYAVLLRLDSAGACPVILPEDCELLSTEQGVRYRLVAQTDDHGEAVRVVEMLSRRLSEQARTG